MKNEKTESIQEIVYIGMFTAILAVMSQFTIVLPILSVPLTLQVFAVAFIGFFLGAKRGSLVVFLYLVLGICGLPIFAGFRGGLPSLVGKTGGFLIGFLGLVVLCGIGSRKLKKYQSIWYGLIGLVICNTLGTLQFSILTHISFYKSFLMVSAPFLLKDGALLILAYFLGKRLKSHLKAAKITV